MRRTIARMYRRPWARFTPNLLLTPCAEGVAEPIQRLDARTEVKSFQYIGHDEEFSVAWVKFKTVGRSGQPIAANVMDTMTVFHQEDGEWKYWSNHILRCGSCSK